MYIKKNDMYSIHAWAHKFRGTALAKAKRCFNGKVPAHSCAITWKSQSCDNPVMTHIKARLDA